MLTKEKSIASINAMPEDKFEDIGVLLDRAVVLEKIEKAENEKAEGNVFTTSQEKEKLNKWLK